MTIIYSNKAKEDLTRINWRIRDRIIEQLGNAPLSKRSSLKLADSEFYKLDLENHIILGEFESQQFNILTIVERQKIKVPQ